MTYNQVKALQPLEFKRLCAVSNQKRKQRMVEVVKSLPYISNLTQALNNLCKLTTENQVLRQLALRRRGSDNL